MRGGDDGLGPRAVQPPRVAAVVGKRIPSRRDTRADVDQIQSRREVVAVGEQDTRAQVSSDSSSAYARDRSASIAMLNALRLSGRFSPMTSTCPSRSSETCRSGWSWDEYSASAE